MGTHISKVRSIELDQHIWTVTLIEVCCLHGMYVKASNKCVTVMRNVMGVRNLCISRVSFLIVAVLFQNRYLFTYLAYSHFAYFKPNSGISPPLKNDTQRAQNQSRITKSNHITGNIRYRTYKCFTYLWQMYLEMLLTYSVRGIPAYTSCKWYIPINVGHIL